MLNIDHRQLKKDEIPRRWWERHFRGFEANLPQQLMINLLLKFAVKNDNQSDSSEEDINAGHDIAQGGEGVFQILRFE